MKKEAFTIAELLITLGILGIIAAIAAPMLSNLRPDSNKISFLKAYDTIASNTQKIISDASIYAHVYKEGNKYYNVSKYPMINTDAPNNQTFDSCSGYTKYGCLMANVLDGDNVKTTLPYYVSFSTNNGFKWDISCNTGTKVFFHTVSVDFDNGKGSYAKQTRFSFVVTPSGNVLPVEPYGQMYLATRNDYKKDKDAKTKVAEYTGISIGTLMHGVEDISYVPMEDLVLEYLEY